MPADIFEILERAPADELEKILQLADEKYNDVMLDAERKHTETRMFQCRIPETAGGTPEKAVYFREPLLEHEALCGTSDVEYIGELNGGVVMVTEMRGPWMKTNDMWLHMTRGSLSDGTVKTDKLSHLFVEIKKPEFTDIKEQITDSCPWCKILSKGEERLEAEKAALEAEEYSLLEVLA